MSAKSLVICLLLVLLVPGGTGCKLIESVTGGVRITVTADRGDYLRQAANNPDDAALNRAIAHATDENDTGNSGFITRFVKCYEQENPGASLAALFVKTGEANIRANSDNAAVRTVLHNESNLAVKRTYNILEARITKYCAANLARPVFVNGDGFLTIIIKGKQDVDRLMQVLCFPGNLQFFETYRNEEIGRMLMAANDALSKHLYPGIGKENTPAASAAKAGKEEQPAAGDTAKIGAYVNKMVQADAESEESVIKKNPLFVAMMPSLTQGGGEFLPGPVVGYAMVKDTAKLNRYLAMEVVGSQLPANLRFMYARAEKKGDILAVYAVKLPTGDVEVLDGEYVTTARSDYSSVNQMPSVELAMSLPGAIKWKKMTGRNIGKYIAVVVDNQVLSCPRVDNEIGTGATEISGSFTVEQAMDLATILTSKKLPLAVHIAALGVLK